MAVYFLIQVKGRFVTPTPEMPVDAGPFLACRLLRELGQTACNHPGLPRPFTMLAKKSIDFNHLLEQFAYKTTMWSGSSWAFLFAFALTIG
jgi:hypothetical protein